MAHSTPQGILDDVAMVSLVFCSIFEAVFPQLHNLNSSPSSPQVLDEEAEVFIVKMWRLLIYETEAKKIGLGKWTSTECWRTLLFTSRLGRTAHLGFKTTWETRPFLTFGVNTHRAVWFLTSSDRQRRVTISQGLPVESVFSVASSRPVSASFCEEAVVNYCNNCQSCLGCDFTVSLHLVALTNRTKEFSPVVSLKLKQLIDPDTVQKLSLNWLTSQRLIVFVFVLISGCVFNKSDSFF